MIYPLQQSYGSTTFLATVEADNTRSMALLERLSFGAATPDEAQPYGLTETERMFVRAGAVKRKLQSVGSTQ